MNVAKNILCYFPSENSWCKLGEIPAEFHTYGKFVPFDGKLYRIVQESSYYRSQSLKQVTYDAYLNKVHGITILERTTTIFTNNICWKWRWNVRKPESKTWEDVTSFDRLDQRQDFCIVTYDNFVYFIGGIEWPGDECRFLSDVDRYDLRKNQWDKVANIQRARKWPHAAAANSKIYIAGGIFQGNWLPESCMRCTMKQQTNGSLLKAFL